MDDEFKLAVCDRYTAAELVDLLDIDVELVYDTCINEELIELLVEDMDWQEPEVFEDE